MEEATCKVCSQYSVNAGQLTLFRILSSSRNFIQQMFAEGRRDKFAICEDNNVRQRVMTSLGLETERENLRENDLDG